MFKLHLSEPQLAKLGRVVATEALAQNLATMAAKGVEGRTVDQYRGDRRQMAQLCAALRSLSPKIDAGLATLFDELEACRQHAQDRRHVVTHAMWGNGDGGKASAVDYRRNEMLSEETLDDAIKATVELVEKADDCLQRVVDLIVAGRLKEGEPPSPAVFREGRWVRL